MGPLPTRKIFIARLLAGWVMASTVSAYEGSRFRDVRDVVFAQPYAELPSYAVTGDLFDAEGGNALLAAARRTLRLKDDLFQFPAGQKLLQANGLCFAGRWIVDNSSPYTGQFRNATTSLVIARISVTLSGTRQDDKRAIGMAIKIFPTENPDKRVPTLNVFVMHSLGGTYTKHVLDLAMDNAPDLGALPSLSQLLTAYRLQRDLQSADEEVSGDRANVAYRPVSHLAAYEVDGVAEGPDWIQLRAAQDMPRIDQDDFRDELQVTRYPNQTLIWDVHAASGQSKAHADWKPLGRLVFTESVVSAACDRQLHFAHPAIE